MNHIMIEEWILFIIYPWRTYLGWSWNITTMTQSKLIVFIITPQINIIITILNHRIGKATIKLCDSDIDEVCDECGLGLRVMMTQAKLALIILTPTVHCAERGESEDVIVTTAYRRDLNGLGNDERREYLHHKHAWRRLGWTIEAHSPSEGYQRYTDLQERTRNYYMEE